MPGGAAHNMGGLAGMLGFSNLASACRMLDAACKAQMDIVPSLQAVNKAASTILEIISRPGHRETLASCLQDDAPRANRA
jgi:hypothetical protein